MKYAVAKFEELERLEIHRRVHGHKSKIQEYGSPEFNEHRRWYYEKGI